MNRQRVGAVMVMLAGVICSSLAFQLWQSGDLTTGIFHLCLVVGVVIAAVAFFAESSRRKKRRDDKQSLKQRDNRLRPQLEEDHLMACSEELMQAAKDLAHQEGVLEAYQHRLREIQRSPATLGEVWLALEKARVDVGVKPTLDDNLLTRLGHGWIKA